MSLLDRVLAPGAPGEVRRRGVGDVVVLHTGRRPESATVSTARGLATDPLHTVVLVDVDRPSWSRLGAALAGEVGRPGTPLRLVPVDGEPLHGLGGEAAAALQRTVVVADGPLRPAADGGRVVAGPTGRWLRFVPHRAPQTLGRRFPARAWESAASDAPQDLGGGVVVEPIPAGVWIHHDRRDDAERDRRARLRDRLVVADDVLTCVLGAPGTPELALDPVAWWIRHVPVQHRDLVRVVATGAVEGGSGYADRLAARLGEPVSSWTALPTTGPDGPEVRIPGHDGGSAWRPWALALGHDPDPAVAPVVLAGRAPWPGALPGGARVGEDAVVEAVPVGLWLRPDHVEDGLAARVRALPVEVDGASLVVGGADERSAAQLEPLVPTVLGRLDGPVPGRVRASELAAGPASEAPEPSEVAGVPDSSAGTPIEGGDTPHEPAVAPAPPPVLPDLGLPTLAPVAGPGTAPASAGSPAVAAPGGPAATARPPDPGQPATPAEPATGPFPVGATASARLGSAGPDAAGTPSGPVPTTTAPASVSVATPASPTPEGPAAPGPAAPGPPAPAVVPGSLRPWPAPVQAASIVVAGRDLAKERAWLRRALGPRYDTAAAVVARVLSENPGLRGGLRAADPDLLADLVALRSHLTDDEDVRLALRDALRSGRPGPHTPFARTVVAGLTRMASHRGLVGTLVDRPHRAGGAPDLVLDAYAGAARTGTPVVEHGFVLLGPATVVPGDDEVAVLAQAATTRRTRSLDPDRDDRVAALPGTAWRVLDLDRTARTVWLREAAAQEPTEAAARLDDAARAALEGIVPEPHRDAVRGGAPGLVPGPLPGGGQP